MKIFRWLPVVVATTLLLAAGPLAPRVCAQTVQGAGVSLRPVDQGWVDRLQDVLAGITTLQGRFSQTAPDGKVTNGMLSLERPPGQPGRMRFDYDAPSPLLLVANDGKVVFQDRSIDQVTVMPQDKTPLGLLLRPDPKLSGDVRITSFVHDSGEVRVALVRTKAPDEGTLTLAFRDQPLVLLGWTVIDAQGRTTRIALSDIKTGLPLAPSLFVLPQARD